MEEVGCEAGEDRGTGRDLVHPFMFTRPVFLDRKAERRSLMDNPGIFPVFSIPSHHVTMLTPLAHGIVMCFLSYVEDNE